MNPIILFALLAALAGCSAIYLASPHQRLRAKPVPAKAARASGGLLLLASLVGFLSGMQATTAVFTFTVCVMLVFVLLPYLAVLLSFRFLRKGR